MGGVTGWCAGFLFQKVGKLAATAVGGGFLLLQIASHSGYVQVDWKRVEKDVNKAKKQLKKRANKAAPEINTLIEEVMLFGLNQRFPTFFLLRILSQIYQLPVSPYQDTFYILTP
uniref:FUN14 domain containing 1 n=1 Tax=Crocodylus porosus TaxID=8502 RepID=A0A7M4FKT9_CROPO